MPLDESVVAAVANYNFKANSERATQNMDAHQQRLQLIAESSIGQIVNKMNSLDISEAVAVSKVASSDLAGKITALTAAVAANQQLLKGAQTTPPETG
jgi:hypothetical protein